MRSSRGFRHSGGLRINTTALSLEAASLPAAALMLALVADYWLGEPPVRWHPVVWMGHYLNCSAAFVLPAPGQAVNIRDLKSFSLGAIVWCGGIAIVLIASCAVQWLALQAPAWAEVLILGLALKPMLAWAMLRSEVRAVGDALAVSLEAGRARLAFLVSRDTANLSASEVRESAIESLAENLNDSVVAPIFWFLIFGLPGAAVYRFANTADAMWGYKGMREGKNWEWAGKWAARADDVLSWLPARLTAGLLILVAGGIRWTRLRTEARKTPSPNSGWPMAAMALALGVCLRKPGVYTLNAQGREPRVDDIEKTIKYASKVLVALITCALLAMVLKAAVSV